MTIKKLKEYFPIILIFLGSIIFTFALHVSGSFSYLEMKLYDFRFSLRGAVSGSLLYNQNAKLPSPESFSDANKNNIWDTGEEFEDFNKNGTRRLDSNNFKNRNPDRRDSSEIIYGTIRIL